MTKEEFLFCFEKLTSVFGKECDDTITEIYYNSFKDLKLEIFSNIVNIAIETKDYFPKIAELKELGEIEKKKYQLSILKYMNEKGYFKSPREYNKAVMWASSKLDQIPGWLKDDMVKYNNQRLGLPVPERTKLTYKENEEDILGVFFNGK